MQLPISIPVCMRMSRIWVSKGVSAVNSEKNGISFVQTCIWKCLLFLFLYYHHQVAMQTTTWTWALGVWPPNPTISSRWMGRDWAGRISNHRWQWSSIWGWVASQSNQGYSSPNKIIPIHANSIFTETSTECFNSSFHLSLMRNYNCPAAILTDRIQSGGVRLTILSPLATPPRCSNSILPVIQ